MIILGFLSLNRTFFVFGLTFVMYIKIMDCLSQVEADVWAGLVDTRSSKYFSKFLVDFPARILISN